MTQTAVTLARSSGLCRLCGATSQQRRILREDMAGLGQWLIQCGHCQGLYLDPDMSPETLQRFYAHDYRRLYPFESCDHPDEAFLHAVRTRETGLRRARALAELPARQGRVLEIGSGHGGFLGRLHHARPDLTLFAVEPDLDHRQLALDGAAVHFLEWSELATAVPFDLIVLFHTLEHILDPLGALGLLGGLLTVNGRIVIEVPGTRPDALSWAEIHPAHVSFFTAPTLHRLCLTAGLHPWPSEAAQAALPGCLWLEGGTAAAGDLPCPAEMPMAVAPPRRHWAMRVMRRWARAVIPANLAGALSRWRHGPALDDALTETGGRLFRWGIGFDPLDMETVAVRAAQAMERRQPFRVADINVAKLVALPTDPSFRMAVQTADAVLIDGTGVLWGARLLGVPLRERVAGIDLLARIMALCAERGFRPFILGARADVVERAVASLQRQHPQLRFAGWRDGYFPPDRDEAVAAELAASGADCLVVALPYPRQDLFLARIHAASGIALAFGVGGSLDVLAGDRHRAPVWMQRCGMEWLFRMVQEPLRLGPRYVVSNTRFLGMLLSQLVARKLARR